MQLFILALFLGLFLHDSPARPAGAIAGPVAMAGLWLGPKLALGLGYWASCAATRRRLASGRAPRVVRRLDWLTMLNRAALLALYGIDLWAGMLVWLRDGIGDWVMLDELVFLLPTLGTVIFTWWAYYPIDRRLREATLMRRLDEGKAVYPIWSREQFVLAQLRHQMALLLVPLVLIFAWIETVVRLGKADWLDLPLSAEMGLTLGGAAVVFIFTPLIIRHVWDTVPLPAGDIRDRLVRMCRLHGVRVRELLLWRTYGGMINAAVMGLVAPLRFILLSDALLEQVPRDEVEAVMAHELAHVRKHHMFWLLAAAGGTLGLIEMVARAVIDPAWLTPAAGHRTSGAVAGFNETTGSAPSALDATSAWLASAVGPMDVFALLGIPAPVGMLVVTLGAAALGWIALFGWVSRRFERQADAFAAVHLAGQRDQPWRDERGQVRIDAASAETMVGALGQVAELNNVPTTKKSWRHGSIAWRQAHLRDLIGRPIDALPIDRVIQRIKLGAVLAVVSAITLYLLV